MEPPGDFGPTLRSGDCGDIVVSVVASVEFFARTAPV